MIVYNMRMNKKTPTQIHNNDKNRRRVTQGIKDFIYLKKKQNKKKTPVNI